MKYDCANCKKPFETSKSPAMVVTLAGVVPVCCTDCFLAVHKTVGCTLDALLRDSRRGPRGQS